MILLIDNYDSFTYNIAQALGELGREILTLRNDAVTVRDVEAFAPEAIVISPGPGRPEDSGITCELVSAMAGRAPILGVCLGHQAIGQVFGAKVVRAAQPVHGKTSEVFHDGRGLFAGLRNPFRAVRYHSLVVPEETVRPPLAVTAYTMAGEVMGLEAPHLNLYGVQFHPESIATAQGMLLFRNFLAICDRQADGNARAGPGPDQWRRS